MSRFLIDHSLTAACLAILVWSVSRTFRRPALVHALWLIVLLKLVTPPLVFIPVGGPHFTPHPRRGHQDQNAAVLPVSTPVSLESPATAPAAAAPPAATGRRTAPETDFDLGSLLLLTWLLGAGCWFVLRLRHAVRFADRVADAAPPSRGLQAHVDRLARRLGLAHAPHVLIVPAAISPMLWGLGSSTRLLFPSGLLESLAPRSRDTLLLHELAHYRRGDHYVRLLEFFIAGLFWWHPLVPFIRRELEANEEKACDAWVVTRLPGSRRTYAEALLSALDFLSGSRAQLPPTATGIGELPLLRERLTEIMRGPPEPRLAAKDGVGLILAGLCALGCAPSWQIRAGTAGGTADDAVVEHSLESEPDPVGTDAPSRESEFSPRLSTDRPEEASPETAPRLTWNQRWELPNDLRASAPYGGSSIVRLENGTLQWLFAGDQRMDLRPTVCAAAYSPDGSILAVVEDRLIQFRDVATGRVVRELAGHQNQVCALAFSPAGALLASGSRDGELRLWNLRGRLQPGRVWVSPLPVNSVAISPDGELLCAALGERETGGGRLVALDLFAGEERFEAETVRGLEAVCFIEESNVLAAGDWYGAWNTWNPATGERIGEQRLLPRDVGDRIRFSPVPELLSQVSVLTGLHARWTAPLASPAPPQISEMPAVANPLSPAPSQAG